MPFDAAVETPALRRSILIDALRNDRDWRWNFCHTAGCALGLAKKVWPTVDLSFDSNDPYYAYETVGKFFGLDKSTAHNIFGTSAYHDADCMEDVTPTMVADALEAVGV